MSFWKKMFGKNDQEVTEENLIVEAEIDESQPEVDSTSEVDNESSDLAEDMTADSSSQAEVTADSNEEAEIQAPEAEGISATDDSQESAKAEPTTEESAMDSNVEETSAQHETEAAEALLKKELESAEASALAAQLEIEKQEFLEDLSVLDGRILPQLKVPDWREELEFVKERYEPCDLSDHIVKVSKRRLTARQIDHELAESRLHAY